MSNKSLYDMYLERLTTRHLKEVSASVAHQQTIIDFGKAMAPFNVRPLVCVHENDGSLSLMLRCLNDTEAGEVMSQLMAAGYDVAEPKQIGIDMDGTSHWSAVVRGHGLEFTLRFDIPSTVAA